jgi:nucleoside-diphosphate-sugar epimerase
MHNSVLVTGAFGLVGTATVRALTKAGHDVVATDIDTRENRKSARTVHSGRADVRWVDLTDHEAVGGLIGHVQPSAIIHLAALIPPFCYANRTLARRVNVDATAALLRSAAAQPQPPRFIQASSIAVYGARNPFHVKDALTGATPVNPCDNYGAHKVEAEALVRRSDLDWMVLRLGGVILAEPQFDIDRELLYFEGLLPADGRIQTVDVRDVAAAFTATVSADVSKEVLLIGGDDSHRQRQGQLTPAFTEALGLRGILPPGRPGDPDSDTAWFHTDWMDCTRAQSLLSFQHHSWPDMMAELAERVGWKRIPLRLAAPLARQYLRRSAPARPASNAYADPWRAIRQRWGDPGPDLPTTSMASQVD